MSHAEQSGEVSRFYLPFDGNRPVLICGHPGSGKTSLARHLIGGLQARTVVVISTSGDDWDFEARKVITLRPEDESSDASFYRHAEMLLRSAVETPGAILVIDDLAHLSESYAAEMPEHQAFLDMVEAVLRVARTQQIRVIVTSSRVPAQRLKAYFGAQFFVGMATPVDWVIMFGNRPQVMSPALRGAGVFALDGGFETFQFPYLPVEQGGQTLPGATMTTTVVGPTKNSSVSGLLGKFARR